MVADELERHLEVAVREARRAHMQVFYRLYHEHKEHEGFRLADWPMTLEIGFVCNCTGAEQEFRIKLSDLKSQVAEHRPQVESILRNWRWTNGGRPGSKKLKRKQRRARMRARALLHSFLTRKQRQTFRGGKFFEIIGSDGERYEIQEASHNNVVALDAEGKPRFSLCLVNSSPVYDMILAQKLLLELDAPGFIRMSNVFKIPKPWERMRWERVEIPEEALDDPGPWVRALLAS